MIRGSAQEAVLVRNNLVSVTVHLGTVAQIRELYEQRVIRFVKLVPRPQTQELSLAVQVVAIISIFIFQDHRMPTVSRTFLMGLRMDNLPLLLVLLKYSR